MKSIFDGCEFETYRDVPGVRQPTAKLAKPKQALASSKIWIPKLKRLKNSLRGPCLKGFQARRARNRHKMKSAQARTECKTGSNNSPSEGQKGGARN